MLTSLTYRKKSCFPQKTSHWKYWDVIFSPRSIIPPLVFLTIVLYKTKVLDGSYFPDLLVFDVVVRIFYEWEIVYLHPYTILWIVVIPLDQDSSQYLFDTQFSLLQTAIYFQTILEESF